MRVLVGAVARGSDGEGVVREAGSTLFIRRLDQRFLFGGAATADAGSLVDFGGVESVGVEFAAGIGGSGGRDCRLFLGRMPDRPWGELTIPSKPRNILAGAIWLSLRMMRRRLPGAGLHGDVDGGRTFACSAALLRNK